MTYMYLDMVGRSDNFSFRVFYRFCKSARSEKRWNVCTVMVLLYIYSKSFGVRLPECPVIKTQSLSSKYNKVYMQL